MAITSFSPASTVLVLLLTSMFLLNTTAAPPPSPPHSGGCSDAVIAFSPCLPYVSAPPNSLSDSPSSPCCEIFTASFSSGEAECLCYLIRQKMILGFPISTTRLLSLSTLCNNSKPEGKGKGKGNSLQSVCSKSPTLPPLLATSVMPPPSPVIPREASGSVTPPPKHAAPPPPPSTSDSKQSNNGGRFPGTILTLLIPSIFYFAPN